MIKDEILELQNKVKELEEKINILSKLIDINLELELDINRRKRLKIKEPKYRPLRPMIKTERLDDRFE